MCSMKSCFFKSDGQDFFCWERERCLHLESHSYEGSEVASGAPKAWKLGRGGERKLFLVPVVIMTLYHRTGFNCKVLMIVNCELIARSQSLKTQ